MDCLNPESLSVGTAPLWKTFPGQIDKVEGRVDGICKNGLKSGPREDAKTAKKYHRRCRHGFTVMNTDNDL